jgi:hypothetical protein
MQKTIARLFDYYDDAANAVAALERDGIPYSHISLMANNVGDVHSHRVRGDGTVAAADDASAGASIGGVVGAAGGVLAGLGLIAVPGLGPVVAAGWLASTLVGALAGALAGGAVGGVVGALTHGGVDERDAEIFAEGVRRGGALVSVRADDAHLARAQAILDRHTHVDLRAREEDFRSGGWTRFDPSAPPYTQEQVAVERRRYL